MTFSINPTAEKTQAMFQQMAIAQNGTGTGSAITGNGGGAAAPVQGSSSVAAGGAAATGAVGGTAAGSSLQPLATGGATGSTGGTGVQSGTGTLDGTGACQCQVICGAGAFPAVQAQGVGGSFGGMPGKHISLGATRYREWLDANDCTIGALPVQSMAAVR